MVKVVQQRPADVTLDKAKLDALAGTLSGGNQQKVALGKWLAIAPRVLLRWCVSLQPKR